MSPDRKAPPDQDVRDRVARDVGRSLAVEAGAGTGKTALLVERVLTLLSERRADLERIAVITFTEKAAGELKVRLRQEIERRLRRTADPEPGAAAALRDALGAIDRASISTIHAFAASLLRERPVEAGLDPRFKVLDELEAGLLLDETFDRLWSQALVAGDGDLAAALRLGVAPRHIRSLALRAAENRDLAPPAAPPPSGPPEDRLERFKGRVGRLRRLAACGVRPEDRGFREIARLQALAARLVPPPPGPAALRLLFEGKVRTTAGSQANWDDPENLREAKTIFKEMEEDRRAGLDELGGRVAWHLGRWLERFVHAYAEALERRGALDFQGLLLRARDLLKDDRGARAYFHRRYRHVLVDEFQDTDPLQAEIIFFLSEDTPRAAEWREARPVDGRLFIVGDPKQSIYRFRRADIEIYGEAQRLLESGPCGGRERIGTNFRTVPGIVSWVNRVFPPLIGSGYAPITAHREPLPGIPPVALLPLPAGGRERAGDAAAARGIEAALVASWVRRAVGDPGWAVQPREGPPRPPGHGDIALLFRALTGIEAFEEAFRAQGIPYRVIGGRTFYSRQETRHLHALLRAIDNPHDAIAVAAALRSPFFGASDEDLLLYATGEGGGLFDYVRDAGRVPAGSAISDAFRLLRDLHARRNDRPPSETLEELLDRTGALALLLLRPQGEQRVANLLKVIHVARRHESVDAGSFRSFVRYVSSMDEEDRQESESPTVEEGEDVVRLMTVHKAKGLEFPIVVLADAAGAPARGDIFFVDRRTRAYHFTLPVPERGGERLGSFGIEAARKSEEVLAREEEARLLYVAATRARDHLVIPIVPHGGRAGGFLKLLMEAGAMPGEGAAPAPAREGGALAGDPPPDTLLIDASGLAAESPRVPAFRIGDLDPDGDLPADADLLARRSSWKDGLRRAIEEAGRGRPIRTASGLEREVFEGTVRPAAPADPGAPAVPPAREIAGHGPAERRRAIGVAVHSVLEALPPAGSVPPRDLLRATVRAAALEQALGAREEDEVERLAAAAFRTSLPARLAAARRYRPELPFAVMIEGGGAQVLLEGRIDLLIEEEGGCVVVDYKTDALEGGAARDEAVERKVEIYRPQAAAYAAALAALGVRVRSVLLVFLDATSERELPASPELIDLGRRSALIPS